MSEETTVTAIIWHQNIPDLFNAFDTDDLETVDQEASGNRYVELANARLRQAYPGAEVECRVEQHMTGWSPQPTVECGDYPAPPVEVDVVQNALAEVYTDLAWVVRLPPRRTKTTIRMSGGGRRKLAWLAERYQNQTTVIEMAVDRMYREEGGR